MANLKFIKGDATLPSGEGRKLIVHVCNDIGLCGKGFIVPLYKRYPRAKQKYLEWFKNKKGRLNLGAVQIVSCGNDIYVANMIGQYGIRVEGKTPPIRYEAIQKGLSRIAMWIDNHKEEFSIHMPRIGCGLAGGLGIKSNL